MSARDTRYQASAINGTGRHIINTLFVYMVTQMRFTTARCCVIIIIYSDRAEPIVAKIRTPQDSNIKLVETYNIRMQIIAIAVRIRYLTTIHSVALGRFINRRTLQY